MTRLSMLFRCALPAPALGQSRPHRSWVHSGLTPGGGGCGGGEKMAVF